MTLGSGVLAAVLLLLAPGALVGRVAALPWPISITVGPALTYGIVGLAIIPFGAAGIPWNAATALVALAVVLSVGLAVRGPHSALEPITEARGRNPVSPDLISSD